MFFYLTTLGLARFLKETVPQVEPPAEGQSSNAQVVQAQNGIAERKNRTLKEMVTAMLISSGMSQDIWGEAILTATYLLNKIPRKEKEEGTPFEYMETRSLSRLDDKVVQDKRQRDDNDLQDERQDQTEEEEVEPRRSKRARNEKSFGPDFVSFMVENKPTSYREAKKMKANGTVDKYKARLVIQGFRQREGLDYFDTYLPVTRITLIRTIIAIVALRNLEIHQMDVKTTFLNRDLEEEIYMNQPEGFIAPGQTRARHIRRLHNSIRQQLSTGVISIDYVASKDNITDPFKKGLSRELVSKSSKGMGLKPLKE
ncbi:retrotransposon protein, putative, ty1-copia subclass [Tanacetum coccineum]|uniref:Retrotransposon protein, putative, ty1-copia subclass n=1 Tax=Tanacetum coccineum TaxID=301880 RepID=A0ABQ4YG53_9ASTR